MAPYRTAQVLFTPEMVNLMTEIDEFRGRWTATQVLAPDRLAALRRVATIESIGSSTRIEGVKLTNTEIEALLRGVKTYSPSPKLARNLGRAKIAAFGLGIKNDVDLSVPKQSIDILDLGLKGNF